MAKTLVIITSYNRRQAVFRLVHDHFLIKNGIDTVVFDDRSQDGAHLDLEMLSKTHVNGGHLTIIQNPEHRGKAGFWQTYNDIFAYCKTHEYDYYIILPDDVEPCPDFVNKAIEAYDKAGCICLSLLLTNRSFLHGISRWGMKNVLPREWGYLSHYFDCEGIMKRDFFEALGWQMMPMVHSGNPYRSSGVGMQITKRLQAMGKRMGHVKQTLLSICESKSQMNPEERLKHPM